MHRSYGYSSMSSNKCIYLCNKSILRYRTLPSSQKVSSCLLPVSPHLHLPEAASLLIFSLLQISFACSKTSYQWNHIAYTLQCKASFTERYIQRFIHVGYFSSRYRFSAGQDSVVCIEHSLFIHSVVGQLGCFQFVAITIKLQ